MALKATIFKASVQISDTDRHYYQTHALTLARHPSETDERMMMRLLAFALHADESLLFGKGLSDDEPDLCQKDLTGAMQLWMDVGQPDEKRLRKACGRASQVVVYSYGTASARAWREGIAPVVARSRNLTVHAVSSEASLAMARLAQRNMALSYTVQEGQVWVADAKQTVLVAPQPVSAA